MALVYDERAAGERRDPNSNQPRHMEFFPGESDRVAQTICSHNQRKAHMALRLIKSQHIWASPGSIQS